MDENSAARAVIWIHGRVQGVGFRWWTRARALELGLEGHVRNAGDGRVEVIAQGERAKIRQLLELIQEKPTRHLRPGQVDTCAVTWGAARDDVTGFVEK